MIWKMKTMSLRTRLSLAFMLIALLLVVLVSLFANFILKSQFQSYTVNKLEKSIQDTVTQISERFSSADSWDAAAIDTIGVNALGGGLMLRVFNVKGDVIWDAWQHNNGFCSEMLAQMALTMQSYDSGFQGAYQERTFPVVINGDTAGRVDVGYYGPYFYNDSDIQFLRGLNQFLMFTAAAALGLSLLLGAFIASRLTRPIASVIEATSSIARGDFGSRVTTRSTTREIVGLTDSVNTMAQELSEQEKLRQQLTADVAHELRTPLATLQSHMEAMIDGVWAPEPRRLISCHEEILRLTKMVGELETLSQVDRERLGLVLETFDLSALIQRLVLNFEHDFQNAGIKLEFAGEPMMIKADQDRISQVLVNLISNALKYTNAGGQVRISLEETPESAVVTVGDTGVGIPPEDLPYIFERFYRTDKSRSRMTGGAGIGLTIARAIVAAHGGMISAESTVGEGSRFKVFLPRHT